MTRIELDCDAVLFDMDGTIVDSRAIVERTWLGWATEHGIPVEAALKVAHGRRTFETMQLLAPEVATPEEAARLDALEEEQEGGEAAIPGALELLSLLPRERWAVVTSAGHALALRRIARVGLPTPAIVIGADDVAAGKPDPEGYLKGATRLGVDPRRCVVFEDTPPGAEAGRSAGARVVGLTTTYSTLPRYDARVADLRAVGLGTPADGFALRLVLLESPDADRK
jgi:mannitol-1-/sugar-/sorbitol-6-phosphatase